MLSSLLPLIALLSPLGIVDSFAPLGARLRAPVTGPSRRARTILSSDSTAAAADAASKLAEEAPPGPQLGAWMPLGSASCLTGINPAQVRLCGLDVAVWHKPLPKGAKRGAVATEFSAFVDACPHRLAPLSQGRVDPDTGCLECPYHGWTFESDGSLMSIPQMDEGRTIEVATGGRGAGAATSLPVHAAGDLLFLFLPTDVTGESWP